MILILVLSVALIVFDISRGEGLKKKGRSNPITDLARKNRPKAPPSPPPLVYIYGYSPSDKVNITKIPKGGSAVVMTDCYYKCKCKYDTKES
jgi:hypothetical protein